MHSSPGTKIEALESVSGTNGAPTGDDGVAMTPFGSLPRPSKYLLSVELTATGAKAELDLDTPSAALDTIVRAKLAGPEGNSITVAAVGDNDALTAAELALATAGAGALDTVVAAVTPGADGNDIAIVLVGDSAEDDGVTIDEDGNTVTIHFEDGVSTVADVETAIGSDATLIEVKTTGTGATVLDAATDEFEAINLAGGLDSEGVTIEEDGTDIVIHFAVDESTVADVEAAITADSTLIEVKTTGTGATVLDAGDEFEATPLAAGAGVACSTDITIYGRVGGVWGIAVAEATVAGTAAEDGSYLEHTGPVSDLGFYERVYIRVGALTGSGAGVAASLTAINEVG